MVKKDNKGSVCNLKTLRLLVEVIQTENGFSYITRTENGVPIASSSSLSGFLLDAESLCSDFENFDPAASYENGEN